MMNMRKTTLLVAVLACLSHLVAGCQSESAKVHRTKMEKMRQDSLDSASFKVGVMPTLDCLPLFVAKEKRLFDTLEVDVRLRRYMAQMDCDTALAKGRVIGSVTDLIRATHLQKRGTSLTFPISTNTYWQLVSNKKARISELKQLSDKMIAMTRKSATAYLADLAVDSAKPKNDVYRVQINDVTIRLRMLLNNEMDAMLLTEPQATKARTEGHIILMDSRTKDLRLGAFAFREKGLKQPHREEQMQKFIKAYNMAVDSINKNGVQAYATIIQKYCYADAKTVKGLPRMTFFKAASPRQNDLNVAASVVK